MKKVLFFMMLLFIGLGAMAQQRTQSLVPQWTSIISNSPEAFQTQLISSTENSIKVNVTVPGFYTTTVTTPQGEAYVITVPKSVSTAHAGEPDVPMTGIPVIIGDKANMNVRVIDAQYMDFENMEVAPSKGDFPRTIDPATVPYTYGECYSQNAFFPASNVGLYDPYIIRDVRGQNIVVYPFAYNPVTKTLRVYYNMTVEMYKVDNQGTNVIATHRGNTMKLDPDFKSVYQRHFINYEAGMSKYTPSDENGDLLIICYDNFISSMTDFVNWKKTRGINTTIVGTSTISSNLTYSNLKTYIQNQYNANNNITHVLLVGDVAQIPGYSYSGATGYTGLGDNPYGQVVGNDIYNDLFIGRFSASSAAQVTTQVNRTITYEKELTTSATWCQNGLGISASESNGGHYNEDDYQHVENLRTDLLNYGYSTVYQDYSSVSGYPSSSTTTISNHINSGVGIINYCNHGEETGWQSHYYMNSNVNALTNDNKLPFIFSVACLVGKYDYSSSDCFAETWMHATNGSNPTGAIGGMFSYISQPWIPPMWAQDEFVDILVESYSNNIKHTLGGAAINGLFAIFDNYSTSTASAVGTYQAWILYGDPSLMVRTTTPQAMSVSHSGSLPLGTNTYNVTVSNGNGAVATITDANHNILGKATVSNGSATITVSGTLTANQELTLCVFGFNKVTYLGTVTVTGGTQYNISASANPTAGGTVSGAGQYYESSQCTLTATANNHYEFSNWTKNGSLVSTANPYTFTVTGTATYVANFTALNPHTVTCSTVQNGTISASPTTAYKNETVTLSATPASGYYFGTWTVTDANNNTIQVTDNQFTMPDANVTVSATFVPGYNVTLASVENGTISANPFGGPAGTEITLTATASTGYAFESWMVYETGNTSNLVTVNNNKFTMPSFDVTVSATFVERLDPETLTINGTGTTTNSYVPIYGLYADYGTISQFIIPASDIQEITAGSTISKLTFYGNKASQNYFGSKVEVKIGEVSYTSFSSTTFVTSDLTTVTSSSAATLTTNASSELEITFETPYTYQGGNLLISVGGYGNTYASTSWTGVSKSDNVAIYKYNSSNSGNIPSGSGTAVMFAPKTTITYIPSITPSISLTPNAATVYTGFTETLTANTYNVSGTPNITYTSSNTNVATVNGSGNTATVTAVSPGTATITASMTYNGTAYTATCAVTVENPSYCEPSFSNPTDDYISKFVTTGGITNINNTSTYESNGYSDFYSTQSASIAVGGTLSCTVTPSSTQWSYGHAIWVDWNRDYEFTSDERVAYTTSTATGDWTGSFTVPANANGGDYRMRVIHYYNNTPTDPCMEAQYGEAEDYKLTVIADGTQYAIAATASPTEGGTVSGGGTFEDGETCTLTATANTGYNFTNWTMNGSVVSTDATYTFDVTASVAYVANFTAIPQYTITIVPDDVEKGSVSFGARSNRDEFDYDFEDGWQGWTTFQGNTTSPHSWMHSTEYYAFDSNGNQLVPECHNSSSGMMLSESYISAATSGGSGTAVTPDNYLVSPQFRLGGSFTFYAASRMSNYPAEKFSVLVSTTGNTSASDFTHTELTVTLSDNSWNEYTIDLSEYAGQTGYVAIRHYDCNDQHLLYVDDVTITEPAVEDGSVSATYYEGETCTVTATPNEGYHFVNWTENGAVASTSDSYTFTVTGDRELVANFSQTVCGIVLNEENDYTWSQNFDSLTTSTTPFTGVKPECWTVVHQYFSGSEYYENGVDTLPQVYYNSNYAHSGNYSYRIKYRSLVAMPELQLDESVDLSRVRLSMWVRQPQTYYKLQVGVMTDLDDESSFVPVALVDNSDATVTYFECGFESYTGSGRYIAFKNVGGSTSDPYCSNYLDDVTLTLMPEEEACGISTLPYPEGFETYSCSAGEQGIEPDCWTLIEDESGTMTTATKPQVYKGHASSGNYSLRLKNRGVYAMPELNVQGARIQDLKMSFQLRQPQTFYCLQVGVVNAEGEFEVVKEICNTTTGMEPVTVNFSSYAGNGNRIAFRNMLRNSANYAYSYNYIDDIVLDYSDVECGVSETYTENFDNFTTTTMTSTGVEPDCWMVISEDVELTDVTRPQVCYGYSTSGNYSLRLKNRCVYAMPEVLDGVEINNLEMSFQLRQPQSFYLLEVGVVDTLGNFEVVAEVNNTSLSFDEVTVNFANYTGSGKRIAFHNILRNSANYDYSYNYIDDIAISTIANKISANEDGNLDEMDADRYLESIAVYPNPTDGQLHIDAVDVQKVEVFNQMGQLVGVYGSEQTVDLGDLAQGVYMVHITVPQGTTVRKVVKR